jgi:hypothetical protein
MLENTEGPIKQGQSKEIDNIPQDEGQPNKNTTHYVLDTTIPNKQK